MTGRKRGKQTKKNSRNLKHQCSLQNLSTLPNNGQIYNRFKTMQQELIGNSNKHILYLLAKELVACWTKQDIPTQYYQTVINKLRRFLKKPLSKLIIVIYLYIKFHCYVIN